MIRVVAGVIHHNGQYLLVRRGPEMKLAGKWEFPGGKIEEGESAQDCLKRELQEELRIDVVVGEHLVTVDHQYPTFTIQLHAYHAELQTPDTLELQEHDQLRWLKPTEMSTYDLADADIPIVSQLIDQTAAKTS